MPAEERVVNPGLVPPRHELPVGVAEETSDVGAGEGETGRAQGEHHGQRHPQVVPIRGVVAGPYRPDALRPREEGARQHERPFAVVSLFDSSRRRRVIVHPERVVHLPVLHVPVVNQVLLHRDLRAVEHGRLVHVVPYVQVFRAALVIFQRKLIRPPRPHRGRRHVQIRAAPGPAPPVEVADAVLLLHE